MSQANENDGIRIIFSAPQLAAALSRQTISRGEMLSNRFWGSLELAGGVLELVGAGALCVAPEPTGLSKAGCVVFGAHGADMAATGARKVWTGQDSATLTQQGVTKLAETMKVDPSQASNIGLSVEMAVPIGLAGMIKAARVASVIGGRISLLEHEAMGGHTLARHINRTEKQLRARLVAEPNLKAASSFYHLQAAESAVSQVLARNATRINAWAKNASLGSRLPLNEDLGSVLGHGVVRRTGKLTPMTKVFVMLECVKRNGVPYYVLTAYPAI
ncbi:hypothetical protein HZU77_013340 [Neisseriaceae bacterium TC5R-5]|nr:hypothetical protein [Neisseriaceae bacterium TC5R-5]